MHCPICGNILQKLDITTNSGGKYTVDHCGTCGGTWFDAYEINRIPFHEVAHLSKLTVLPHTPPASLPTHICPRCHTKLQSFQPESVPANIRFLKCLKCHGIWATQKTLENFKSKQVETIKEYKTKHVAFPSLSVVFVPALFTLFLFLTTFLTINALKTNQEGRIKAESLIQNISIFPFSAGSASITFDTTASVKSAIHYGFTKSLGSKKEISLNQTTKHRILLSNLKPYSIYYYIISIEDEKGRTFQTDLKTFQTLK